MLQSQIGRGSTRRSVRTCCGDPDTLVDFWDREEKETNKRKEKQGYIRKGEVRMTFTSLSRMPLGLRSSIRVYT